MKNPITRRTFVQSTSTLAAAALALNTSRSLLNAAPVDRSIQVKVPSSIQQADVLFDPRTYTAFPHVIRLEGDELLMAFRQAPREKRVRHTHPRSIITVIRSYDLGKTWDIEGGSQLAAGGGQEFAPIYLGKGVVGGLLATHEVVPVKEAKRSGIPHKHRHEYPFGNVGGFWNWSNNHGLTWPLHHNVLFAPKLQTCSPPIQLHDGTLLAPCYGNKNSRASSNWLYRSKDGGKTWSAPTSIAKGTVQTRDYYEPVVLEVAENHLLGMHRVGRCRDGRHGLLWQNESRDGGKTWSTPRETNITSGACPRLLKLADGRILLTFGRRYKPFGLYARLSSDGGKSWGKESWLLRAAPNSNQGYSSSIEIAAGRVFTACYASNSKGVTGITGTFWNVPAS